MIQVTPYANTYPIQIPQSEYDQFVQKKERGWSVCQSQQEFLCKLHYLRAGYLNGKIGDSAFREKEIKLILNWWNSNLF